MPDFKLTPITPTDAIRTLDRRTDFPKPTFSWLDVWQQQHSTMFTVAKSAGYDILSDVSGAVDDALKNGTTFEEFRRQLEPTLRDKGWWGRGPALDPATGQMVDAQLGSVRRLQTIFDVNMRQSYAAGRWAAIQRVKADRPYLQYMHTTSAHPRAEHLAWNGITLPVDHPFWLTHYPPNGWGCHCTVLTLSQNQYDEALGNGDITTDAPPLDLREFVNKRTGQRTMVPAGIDPGFGYNVGEAFLAALAA